jgi:hypothetical protein
MYGKKGSAVAHFQSNCQLPCRRRYKELIASPEVFLSKHFFVAASKAKIVPVLD